MRLKDDVWLRHSAQDGGIGNACRHRFCATLSGQNEAGIRLAFGYVSRDGMWGDGILFAIS